MTSLPVGTDLAVSRLGFGAMRLTGPGMWGDVADRAAAIALLRRVADAGITFIDTADAYGPHTNELLIREALHPYASDLVIATKGGFIRGGPDYADFGAVGDRAYLRQCAFLSARRLGVERIDLYYLHSAQARDVPFADQIATLAELREQGIIRHIGLSNVTIEQFRIARSIVDIAAVTAHYNVIDRTGAPLLAAAEAAGIAFSPWHPTTVADGRPLSAAVAEAIDPVAVRTGASRPQIALAWLLHSSPLMLPIPGTTSTTHFDANLAAASIALTADEVATISAAVAEP